MSEPALRLIRDDGAHHEIERLRRDLQLRTEALQRAYEDAAVKDEMLRKYHNQVSALKAQLTRQERETRNVNHELVVAVFDFWKALKGGGRGLKRGPKRAGAILAGLSWDPPMEPLEYIYPVIGIVAAPVPKKNGVDFHDELTIAVRDEEQVRKWTKIGQRESAGDPRGRVAEMGGDPALVALDRLLGLQERWGVGSIAPKGKEAQQG